MVGNLDRRLARFAKPMVLLGMGFDHSAYRHSHTGVNYNWIVSLITKYEDEFDRESFEELKRARFALMVDAEIALCNGTSKDEWRRSPYVKATRDKVWWLEDEDIYYIAEYVWHNQPDYFLDETK